MVEVYSYGGEMCTLVFQIEDIRNSIDKIDENVSVVKKLYSVILSAPTSEQSKIPSCFHSSSPNSHFLFFCWEHIISVILDALSLFPPSSQKHKMIWKQSPMK